MFVEINLLKTKHGVLARYEKEGHIENVGGLHKKRTFSILLIVVLLGVFAGLQYGERLFFPLQEPLIKSLDYALELIPKLMKDMKGEEDVEEEVENVEPFFEIPDEGMKKKPSVVAETAPPVPVSPEEVLPEAEMLKDVQGTAETAVNEPVSPVIAEDAVEPQEITPKEEVKEPVRSRPSSFLNAGSYLMPDNIEKLKSAGKKQGFSVKVNTVYRNLPNYALFLGNITEEGKVAIVERDLKKRSIPVTVESKGNGTFDIYTGFTPLKFQMEKQEEILKSAGYVIKKKISKKKKTPLNQILVGPLEEDKIQGVTSYLKQNGFPAQRVKE